MNDMRQRTLQILTACVCHHCVMIKQDVVDLTESDDESDDEDDLLVFDVLKHIKNHSSQDDGF